MKADSNRPGRAEMNADEQANVRRMVGLLTDAYAVERVYLFGSRARGEARPDSDYDLLIVSDDPRLASLRPRRRITEIFQLFFRKIRVPLDVIVRTGEEFRRMSGATVTLDNTVLEEGILVYAHDQGR